MDLLREDGPVMIRGKVPPACKSMASLAGAAVPLVYIIWENMGKEESIKQGLKEKKTQHQIETIKVHFYPCRHRMIARDREWFGVDC